MTLINKKHAVQYNVFRCVHEPMNIFCVEIEMKEKLQLRN